MPGAMPAAAAAGTAGLPESRPISLFQLAILALRSVLVSRRPPPLSSLVDGLHRACKRRGLDLVQPMTWLGCARQPAGATLDGDTLELPHRLPREQACGSAGPRVQDQHMINSPVHACKIVA